MLFVDCLDVSRISEAQLRQLYLAADEERRARADRYGRREEAVRCLAAGALLRHALRRCGRAERMPLLKGAEGKPYVALPDFYFNLSHGGDFAVIAYSDREVGVDVETVEPSEHRLRVSRRFFTDAEQEEIFAEGEANAALRFARVWTAKEAYVKYVGCGLTVPLDSFSVDVARGCVQNAEGIVQPLRLQTVSLDERHVLTVCAEAKEDICIERLSPAVLLAEDAAL